MPSLPAPVSALYGREHLLASLAQMLGESRLVTLTGVGGCGKTRLAIEVGRRAEERYPDGAAFVDLSTVREAAAVPDEVCRQLRIASLPGADPSERLCEVLAERHRLVVVDNVEQVLDAAPVFARLIATCPRLTLLVTSRRRLELSGERVVPVPPLSLADDQGPGPAVALYCDRASAVDVAFAPDPTSLDAVAEICRRLDGLPLAIELAAARSRSLPPPALLAALTSVGPWRLLERAPRDAPDRHQSLRAALTWSVDLLSSAERTLFRRLGVFQGSWSMDAAEAICSEAGVLDSVTLLDALSTLVDVHLVEPVSDPAGLPQYRLLDTIADVARSLVELEDDWATLRKRHAEHFLGVLHAAGAGLEGPEEASWYRRVDVESRDLQAAMSWAADGNRWSDVLVAAVALGPYWLHRGRFGTGRRWLDVGRPETDVTLAARARGWSVRLTLDGQAEVYGAGDARAAIDILEEDRDTLRDLPDPRPWLRAGEHLSYAHRLYGDPRRGQQVTRESLARCVEPELGWWRAEHLLRRSLLEEQLGDPDAPRTAREAAAVARRSGNIRVHARAEQAEVLSRPDVDDRTASARLQAVLAESERVGDRRGAVTTRIVLGALAVQSGDRPTAGACLALAISESQEIGYQHGVGLAAVILAMQAAGAGDWAVAAALHGGLSPMLPTLRRQLTRPVVQAYQRVLVAVERALGLTQFQALAREAAADGWPVSTARALARAQALARRDPSRALPPTGRSEPGPSDPLSPRERQVLVLIARGLSNQEIGHELYLSPKTVMHHSGHIYRKLGVRGRAEAATWAVRQGLLDDTAPA